MKLMNNNFSPAEEAAQVKLAVGEFTRMLKNTLNTAFEGLSDRREISPNPDATNFSR